MRSSAPSRQRRRIVFLRSTVRYWLLPATRAVTVATRQRADGRRSFVSKPRPEVTAIVRTVRVRRPIRARTLTDTWFVWGDAQRARDRDGAAVGAGAGRDDRQTGVHPRS